MVLDKVCVTTQNRFREDKKKKKSNKYGILVLDSTDFNKYTRLFNIRLDMVFLSFFPVLQNNQDNNHTAFIDSEDGET